MQIWCSRHRPAASLVATGGQAAVKARWDAAVLQLALLRPGLRRLRGTRACTKASRATSQRPGAPRCGITCDGLSDRTEGYLDVNRSPAMGYRDEPAIYIYIYIGCCFRTKNTLTRAPSATPGGLRSPMVTGGCPPAGVIFRLALFARGQRARCMNLP